ncbi:SusC/RagA family TonB-linked outer membrane protein [Olivibacter sp. SDN3]|uniref:SusC/RagA family TonB-linked outer membrane protein n=1 Tax=Olivibacter sp. SDN3 TaxID=2764720 RepID=UPI0016515635|nr:SusC/RagA family TonB-linked outer membrane protein [Olivibacter sp. SDN3]QNL50839.1 SusC/RagA family TonB-linked outer membrane protein [Olivibacter sp. SDN3]
MKQKLLSFFLACTLLIGAVHAQQRVIRGKVTSAADGATLAGATVSVVGTTVSVQVSSDGNYEINVPGGATELSAFYLGFDRQTIATEDKSVINFALSASSEMLSEVIVHVPYGSMRKTAFTGSESTISAKNFENQQVSSFTRALEGVAPGVQATNGGGAPGTSADIRIRGIGSVNANSSPLYVVDGVPYVGSNISLSTDDIETTTVLKDAAATALYGSRAANGVVMITTKKGRDGSPELAFTARTGFVNRAIPEYDRVNVPQYYEGMWHATYNRIIRTQRADGTFPTAEEARQSASTSLIPGNLVYNNTDQPNNLVVLPNGQFNPDASILYQDDWQDVLFRSPFRQDYNLNVRGGTDKGNYYISMGYLNEPGYVKFTGYERFTGRVNVNSKIKEWLSAGLNADGALGYQDNLLADGTFTTNPFYYTRIMGPIYPVWQRDQSGSIVIDPLTGQQVLDWGTNAQMGARPYAGNSNLLGSLDLDDRSGKTGNMNFNTYLEARFLNNFTFRTTLGGNYFNRYGTTFQNPEFGDAANVSGRSTKNQTRQLSFTFNQILTYDKTFNEDHHLNVLVGHENYRNTRNFLNATRSGFPFPGNTELAPAATLEAASSYEDYHRIEGYLSRANYSYKERYLFSASFRRDGTSRFFPGIGGESSNQWGNFFSIGAGWRLSEEAFLQHATWVNELKLRGSYGEQGNEGVQRTRPTGETDQENPGNTNIDNFYGWQSLYTFGWNNVNFPGVILNSLPNQGLTWEKNRNLNIGLDFQLFNNRIEGSVEWYNRESSNLLFQVPLPLSTGGLSTGDASIWRNVGTMYNRGVEVQLGYNAIRKTDFDWRIDLNLSHYRNKVTRLAPENREGGIIEGTKKIMEGEDVYRFWLRDYAGVDPDNGDALWYQDVLDDSGNPTGERITTNNINQASFYYHGSAIPDLFGGLTNSFRYKGFDLSVLLTFQLGGQFYDGNYAALMHMGSYGSNWHADILDAWKQPGDVTDVPRLQNAIAAANAGNSQSSRFLFDASYLNIKNITFGYNLPQQVVNNIGLTRLRVFANVDNAHIFTSRKGMDPQRAFTGVSDFTYPTMRNFTFGVTIGL